MEGWRRELSLDKPAETMFSACGCFSYQVQIEDFFIFFHLLISKSIYILKVPFKHRHAILSQGSRWVEVQYLDIFKLSPCKITHWIIDTQSAMRSRDRRKTFQHLSESVGPLLIYWSRLSDSDEQSVTEDLVEFVLKKGQNGSIEYARISGICFQQWGKICNIFSEL